MTFSIIARDETTGRFGIAVASKFLAVGARNAFIKTGVGAVATQAFFNPYYGPRGLALLTAGASAQDTIRMLTTADEGRHMRQVHVMDRRGNFVAHTGPHWKSSLTPLPSQSGIAALTTICSIELNGCGGVAVGI